MDLIPLGPHAKLDLCTSKDIWDIESAKDGQEADRQGKSDHSFPHFDPVFDRSKASSSGPSAKHQAGRDIETFPNSPTSQVSIGIPDSSMGLFSAVPAHLRKQIHQLSHPQNKAHSGATEKAPPLSHNHTPAQLNSLDLTAVAPIQSLPAKVTQTPGVSLHSLSNQGQSMGRSNQYASNCLKIYDIVKQTGVPNYAKARIPLQHGLNIQAWRKALEITNYPTAGQLCDFLEFGFPIGCEGDENILIPVCDNHSSAINDKQTISDYIDTETRLLALAGPFITAPFYPFMISPMMTRPKNSQEADKRRTIVDLSWPINHSVNSTIPRDTYLGQPHKVSLPTVDDMVDLIVSLGPGCYLYTRDLSRAYRQLRSCPLSWPKLGITHDNKFYFDTAICFGLRTGAKFCQDTTNAISHIAEKKGYNLKNYIDDFIGAEKGLLGAEEAYFFLEAILEYLGLEENKLKAQPPATRRLWLGVIFDTIQMILEMPEYKIKQTLGLVKSWLTKTSASKRELQSLLGKLFHISKCVKNARLFVGRMLTTLRQAPDSGHIKLDTEFKKDLKWFHIFLPQYNGISMMSLPALPSDKEIYLDSCLTGCGGICGLEYYHAEYPQHILDKDHHISRLEILNIMLACKLFHKSWSKQTVTIFCDNAAAVYLLQTGRCKDEFMMACARNIWMWAAIYDFKIIPKHRPGVLMQTADALSRIHLSGLFREKCVDLIDNANSKQIKVKSSDFTFHFEI